MALDQIRLRADRAITDIDVLGPGGRDHARTRLLQLAVTGSLNEERGFGYR
jgi:hypothetical protein